MSDEQITFSRNGEPTVVVERAVIAPPPKHGKDDCPLPISWESLEPLDVGTVLRCVKCDRLWRIYRYTTFGFALYELVDWVPPEGYDTGYYRVTTKYGRRVRRRG